MARSSRAEKQQAAERYDPEEMTAAHRTLPFGTIVRVINLRNNKSVTVRITNRGPFVRGRIVDVSRAAAHKLDMMKSGVTRVPGVEGLRGHSTYESLQRDWISERDRLLREAV